jgi:hypothetical protein
MIKSIITYFFVFFSVFFLSFYFHENYLDNQEVILPFSLKKVYLFHFGFSLLICTNFLLFSTVDKIFEQLGFIYLATLVLKIILFCIIFYQSIFKEEELSQIARISLFIPSIIFLLTEAIFVAKILNKKQ